MLLKPWEKEYFREPEKFTFEYFKKSVLNGKPLAQALAVADEELLNYWEYRATKRVVPRMFPDAENYEKLERWFSGTFFELLKERTDLAGVFEKIIKNDFIRLRKKIIGMFYRDRYLPEMKQIQLFKKIIRELKGDPTVVDEISFYLLPGSSLFMLELYVRLIEGGILKPFQQEITEGEDSILSELFTRPLLLVDLWKHQKEAIDAWLRAGGTGIVEMATATGKTLVGLAAALKLYEKRGKLDVLVTAHSRAILNQWRREAIEKLGFLGNPAEDYTVPLSYTGERGEFRIEFNTIQTVYKNPENYSTDFLIVDEVHHGAARKFRRALTVRSRWKMGLSATVEGRERLYYLEKYLGRKVYTLSLAEARKRNIIPDFELYIHETYLDVDEEEEFRRITGEIVKLFSYISSEYRDLIRELSGGEMDALETLSDFIRLIERARYSGREIPDDWFALRNLILKRRQLIHRYGPKIEKAVMIARNEGRQKKCIMFAMDIQTCERIFSELKDSVNAYLVHSGLPSRTVRENLEEFRRSKTGVLLAPRMLDEGIDVPDAEIGINVASSKTRLQLVQRIGRILRKKPGKKPVFHHFVVVPRKSCFVDFEDAVSYLEDLSWIQEVALKMGVKAKTYQEDRELSDLRERSEKYIMKVLERAEGIRLGNFGTIRLHTILEQFDRPVKEKLLDILADAEGKISDEGWADLLRRAHGYEYGQPINIPGHWWLLIAGDRDPRILREIIRKSM